MAAFATCQECGAKVRGDRSRCPRCRAYLSVRDAAQGPVGNRQLVRAAAVVVGLFALTIAGLWLTREPAAVPRAAGPVPDTLAARRSAPDVPLPADVAPTVGDRPFLDPAGSGSLAYASGDYNASLAHYLEAVRKNPDDAESLSNLGQVLVRLNRTAESIPHFERAVAILPGRWAYHFNLARALGLLNRHEGAVAGYRRAQELFPDDYVTTFNLALALHRKGDESAAVEQYRRAIVLQPEDASFHKALGISLEQLQKGPEAAAAYGEYLRLSPSAPDAEKVRARIAQLQAGAAGETPVQAPGALLD